MEPNAVSSGGETHRRYKPPPTCVDLLRTEMHLRLMNDLRDEALGWAAVKIPRGHGFFIVSNDVCE